jgi:hypothetical protein
MHGHHPRISSMILLKYGEYKSNRTRLNAMNDILKFCKSLNGIFLGLQLVSGKLCLMERLQH